MRNHLAPYKVLLIMVLIISFLLGSKIPASGDVLVDQDDFITRSKSRIGCTGAMAFVVDFVNPGDPAQQAGLKAGDLIISLNGKQINSIDDFQGQILQSPSGTSFDLTYRRYDPATGILEERQASLQTRLLKVRASNKKSLHSNQDDFITRSKSRIGCTGAMAFVVDFVNPGDPAQQAGLKAGDLIISLNGKQINSIDDFQGQILQSPSGTSFDLTYRRYDPATGILEQHQTSLQTRPIEVAKPTTMQFVLFTSSRGEACPEGCCSDCMGGVPPCRLTMRFTGKTFCRRDFRNGLCTFTFCI